MSQFITDSSVWIDYFNGIENKETEFLNRGIEHDQRIAICPAILQEVLQGIRDDLKFALVREEMMNVDILEWDILTASIEAASLFRSLKKKGITIRNGVDCLIASYAIQYNIPLLHRDKDFEKIALHSPLKIVSIK